VILIIVYSTPRRLGWGDNPQSATITGSAYAQDLPARRDELAATDWPKALAKSNRTDLIRVRDIAGRATKTEYAVVFARRDRERPRRQSELAVTSG